MRSIKILTSNGPVELTTLRRFIKLIRVKEFSPDVREVDYIHNMFVDRNVKRVSLKRQLYNSLEKDLESLCDSKYISRAGDRHEIATEAIYERQKDHLDTTHAVSLGSRWYCFTNPDDYVIFVAGDKCSLVRAS